MNVSEDEVRAATRAAAAVITDDTVPPLRLEESLTSYEPARRTRRGWMAPVAAAAAVALVVGGGTILGSRLASSGHARSGRSSTRTTFGTSGVPGVTPGLSPSAYVRAGIVPPYYVTLANSYAAVHATATGATLARIPTHTPFVGVASAADDRTFVLDAQRSIMGPTVQWPGQPAFSLLRLSASGAEQSLTPLTVPALPAGSAVTGLALSADGSKLAIEVDSGTWNHLGLQEIMIDTLATGATHVWSTTGSADAVDPGGFTGSGVDGSQTISWTADSSTLAFDWRTGAPEVGVRLLDTTASGDNLIADSRLAVVESTSGPDRRTASRSKDHVSQCVTDGLITPDGSSIVCGYATTIGSAVATQGHPGSVSSSTSGYIQYSTRTGKVSRVFGVFGFPGQGPGGDNSLYWTDATGKTLIGGVSTRGGIRVGVISGETFTPLPGIGYLGGAAW
jgi:hypothetical protein